MLCTIDSFAMPHNACHVLLTVLPCPSVYVMYYWQFTMYQCVCHALFTVYYVSVCMSCIIGSLLCHSVYVMHYWQFTMSQCVCHVLLTLLLCLSVYVTHYRQLYYVW